MGRIRIVKEYQPEIREIEYSEEEFEKKYVLLCDNYSMGEDADLVIVQPQAAEEMLEYIGWGTRTQENRVEQGGFLVGRNCYDKKKKQHICLVERALPARGAVGSWGFLEMSHEDTREMHRELDQINADCPEEKKMDVVGWFHTHANALDVFMSATDRGTQSRLFSGERAIAMVLNPHRKIWKCYRSGSCEDTKAELLISDQTFQKFGKKRLVNHGFGFGGKKFGSELPNLPLLTQQVRQERGKDED